MTFHICGQCVFFHRDSHPEDEEQSGECRALPPTVLVFEAELINVHPRLDPACDSCALFRENKR